MILSPRVCCTTSANTAACSRKGVPTLGSLPSSPIISTSSKRTVEPGSPATVSTTIMSSLVTLYCLPPVLMTANMVAPPGQTEGRPAIAEGPEIKRRHYSPYPLRVNGGRACGRARPAACPWWAFPVPSGAVRGPPSGPRPGAEGCRSGRTGRSRKPLYPCGYRGFESHPLRQSFNDLDDRHFSERKVNPADLQTHCKHDPRGGGYRPWTRRTVLPVT